MQCYAAKRQREMVESTADESGIDFTEDDTSGASDAVVSTLIAGLRLEFDALPKAPEGIIVAGVIPGQVINLSHMFAMRDALMSRTFNVLESFVRHFGQLPAEGSSRQAGELLAYASKATGKRKKMRVAAVALTRGVENGIKVRTTFLL
jgi:hypothetical protein